MLTRIVLCALTLLASLANLSAQEFKLFDREIQVHGFASQGFAYGSDNNYLTMDTSNGSFAFTDAGFNMSTLLTDHFRIGAQVYDRNIGQLGNFHPNLDWAYGDYRFTDWFGIRIGKVKTALGLYNDTQDEEFLYTWAMLPQSVYPLDLRSATLAHTGADVYGRVPLGSLGTLNYTGYWGLRSFDKYGGIYFFSKDSGFPIDRDSGHVEGADLRWNPPVSGLLLGASTISLSESRTGHYTPVSTFTGDYTVSPDPDYVIDGYGDYTYRRWHFSGEFRREFSPLKLTSSNFPGLVTIYEGESNKSGFVSMAFRISKRIELGTYHSRYYVDHPNTPADPDSNHIYDETATLRFDIKRWWDFKVEGHFIQGYGDVFSAHGFYGLSNPDGLHSKTNLLVLRSGVNF